VEIEAKLKVDSFEPVLTMLEEAGAEFVGEFRQFDTYFDDADKTLSSNDKALRIRRQVKGDSEKIIVTCKGAKEASNYKVRSEDEVEVAEADSMERILNGLGFEKKMKIEKRRRMWRLGGCLVTLDELPLIGSFVEIEGPADEQIADVQTRLGLSQLKHIPQSYAKLIRKKLRELGRDDTEVLLG